jgi:hypothetical protein
MINEDNKFQAYASELVNNVPLENMEYLIALFMKEAAINMGSDVNDSVIERTVYHVKKDYGWIPVNYVASAFVRGSLGKIGDGKGRLIPKTILAWLSDSSQEYNRVLSALREKEKLNDVSIAMDLHKTPVGTAIMKKLDWYKKGALKIQDWDKIPLSELANKIKQGVFVTPEMFGIKSKS